MFSENIIRYNHRSPLSSSDTRVNPFNGSLKNEEEIQTINEPDELLSSTIIVKDHFYKPLINFDNSSVEQLTTAVKECKQTILQSMDNEDLKSRYISQLVCLNQRLHTIKEEAKSRSESLDRNLIHNKGHKSLKVAGHYLVRSRKGLRSKKICEICRAIIHTGWSVYNCNTCGVYVHSIQECLGRLHRVCPASNIGHPSLFPSEIISAKQYSSAENDLHIIVDSFPLSGNLVAQKFLCNECNAPIGPAQTVGNYCNPNRRPSLFCYYYRKFYCSSCHWEDKYWIPAIYFIMNRWTKMPVCRSAFLKLKYIWNHVLFRQPIFWEHHNSNANEILMIRLKIFRLKIFINKCDKLKTLTSTQDDWMIDQPYNVTMQFVQKISNGSAAFPLLILYSNLIDHIPDCDKCKSLCNTCLLCDDPQMLFPRSGSTWSCYKCYLSFIHEVCGVKIHPSESDFICIKCQQ